MSQRRKGPPTRSEMAPLGSGRYRFMVFIVMVALALLVGRIIDLHVLNRLFLQDQGDARTLRVEAIDAHRGMITDRNGDPLAISTPVVTLWANPQQLPDDRIQRLMLAKALGVELDALNERVELYAEHEFMYLERRMTPVAAQHVLDLHLPGVYGKHEYKRYYPSGEVAAQLVGITNIDDQGQEGLELAYNGYLAGDPGKRLVLKDRKDRLVKDLRLIEEAKPGGDLALAIDLRLQYMAYRELKAAVNEHNADGGTLVMMDARNGEVLAMANVPSYNPNNRSELDAEGLRNQAITDTFEPGSVVKPLAMSAALATDKFAPETIVDTSPGYMRLDGEYTISDFRNYGKLTMGGILLHSSNVGMSRVALQLDNDAIWNRYHELGFGQSPGTGFPGEANGSLPAPYNWSESKRATMAYGYGVAVSALQLASAFTAIANDGKRLSASLLKLPEPAEGKRVMSERIADNLLLMLEQIVQPGAGGSRAAVPGYRIAGKTGTVRKVTDEGYQTSAYRSLFAGIAPVTDPRIVTIVMVDHPKGQEYYGGLVAAPVFARVVGKALRLLDVLPDKQEAMADADKS